MTKDNKKVLSPLALAEFQERKYVEFRKAGFSVKTSISLTQEAVRRIGSLTEADPAQISMF